MRLSTHRTQRKPYQFITAAKADKKLSLICGSITTAKASHDITGLETYAIDGGAEAVHVRV